MLFSLFIFQIPVYLRINISNFHQTKYEFQDFVFLCKDCYFLYFSNSCILNYFPDKQEPTITIFWKSYKNRIDTYIHNIVKYYQIRRGSIAYLILLLDRAHRSHPRLFLFRSSTSFSCRCPQGASHNGPSRTSSNRTLHANLQQEWVLIMFFQEMF